MDVDIILTVAIVNVIYFSTLSGWIISCCLLLVCRFWTDCSGAGENQRFHSCGLAPWN